MSDEGVTIPPVRDEALRLAEEEMLDLAADAQEGGSPDGIGKALRLWGYIHALIMADTHSVQGQDRLAEALPGLRLEEGDLVACFVEPGTVLLGRVEGLNDSPGGVYVRVVLPGRGPGFFKPCDILRLGGDDALTDALDAVIGNLAP